MVIAFAMKAEIVDALVADPGVMIASDGMPFFEEKVHPRGAGTFARVLGRYVREQRALPLMTALRKMTLMPAQRLEGLAPAFRDKGRERAGADADLTSSTPRASPTTPPSRTLQPSTGIVHVLVGGVFVVKTKSSWRATRPGRGMRDARRSEARRGAARGRWRRVSSQIFWSGGSSPRATERFITRTTIAQ